MPITKFNSAHLNSTRKIFSISVRKIFNIQGIMQKSSEEEIPDDCNEAQADIQTAYTANAMYYVDYNEYAPNISALFAYGYIPTELSTGFVQYGVNSNKQVSGWWEESRREVACPGENGSGRWTLEQNVGDHVWRNDFELQSWRDLLGI